MAINQKTYGNPVKDAIVYYTNAPYGAQILMGSGILFIIYQAGVINKNWSAHQEGYNTLNDYYSSEKKQSDILSNKISTLFIGDALAWGAIISVVSIINAYKKYAM